jgi:hypothetical protein
MSKWKEQKYNKMLIEELKDLKMACRKNGATTIYNKILKMLREKHPLEGAMLIDDMEKVHEEYMQEHEPAEEKV